MALTNDSRTGRKIVWSAAAILALLHQDFWLWDDKQLVFGFLPSGLGYHIVFSLLVAALWATALRHAWPSDWEAWAEEPNSRKEPPPGA